MRKAYSECEECRTRNSARAWRCDACGGTVKRRYHGMTLGQRAKGYIIAISVGLLVALLSQVLYRFV